MFIMVTLAILVVKDYVALGYERSIFYSFSSIFFILFIIPLILAGVFFWYINSCGDQKISLSYVLIWTFLIAIQISFIILLPQVKGYAFYPMGDIPTHLGHVLDILKTGRVNETLIYPIEHIYIVIISQMTSLSIYTISFLLKFLFLALYSIFIYMFSNYLLKNIYLSYLIAIIATIQIARFQQTPHEIGALFLPLIIYIYFKSKTELYNKHVLKLVFLVFLILYPFLHPLLSIVLVFSIITFDLAILLFNFAFTHKCRLKSLNVNVLKSFSLFPVVGLVILCSWLWSHYWFWNYQVGRIFRWLLIGSSDEIGRYESVASIFSIYNINPIQMFVKYYFINILIIVVCFLCLVNIYCHLSKNSFVRKEINLDLVTLSSFILLMGLIGLFSIFAPTFGGPERMFFYASLISPIYFGFYLFKSSSKVRNIIALVLIVIIFSAGPFLVHQSDLQNLPNLQVTDSELKGMNWFVSTKNENINCLYNHERPSRLSTLILGHTESRKTGIISSNHKPLPHFGLDLNAHLGAAYSENKYLLLGKYDEELYLYLYPKSLVFNAEDFLKIENDLTVSNIYENNEFRIYYVKSTG